MLSLSEKLMLLALHDEKGSVIFSASTALPYGLSGALIIDLLFQERIALVEGKIKVRNPRPTGDGLLDETLQLIRASDKPRDIKYWVQRIYSKVKDLQKRVSNGLIEKKILERREQKILWVFPSRRYPTIDAAPENEIRNNIHEIVLRYKAPEKDDIALLSLVKSCDLINEVFDKPDRKIAKKRIEAIITGEIIGKAVTEVVTAVVAITAVIGASVAVTAATS